jgi:hypothetical protein
MASAQSATSASIARPPRSGFGGLVAWCYDHRRQVLVAGASPEWPSSGSRRRPWSYESLVRE